MAPNSISKTILFAFTFWISSCTFEEDNGLEFQNSTSILKKGFVTGMELDSQNVFHNFPDTLSLRIYDFFTVSPCLWESTSLTNLTAYTSDKIYTARVDLKLAGENDLNCPQPGVVGDTTIKIVLADSLQNYQRLNLWGKSGYPQDTIWKNDSLKKEVQAIVYNDRIDTLIESIELRWGTRVDTTFEIKIDSLGNVVSAPIDVKYIRAQVDSNRQAYYIYRYNRIYEKECQQELNLGVCDETETILDTIYSINSFVPSDSIWDKDTLKLDTIGFDTLRVTYAKKCSEVKDYCRSDYWGREIIDSTSQPENFVFPIYHSFLVEKRPSCYRLNSLKILKHHTLGSGESEHSANRTHRFTREWMVLDSTKQNCASEPKGYWGIDLKTGAYGGSGDSIWYKNHMPDSLNWITLKTLDSLWLQAK
jgi:hypothetical protein